MGINNIFGQKPDFSPYPVIKKDRREKFENPVALSIDRSWGFADCTLFAHVSQRGRAVLDPGSRADMPAVWGQSFSMKKSRLRTRKSVTDSTAASTGCFCLKKSGPSGKNRGSFRNPLLAFWDFGKSPSIGMSRAPSRTKPTIRFFGKSKTLSL